jgi:hypothetical protein
MAGPRNPSEADTVVGGREASTCRCDASWPRQANWVKITPSAPAISNCSQELSRRINPGHRTTQRGQQTSEFNGRRRPRRKVVDRPSRGLGRHQPVRKRLPQIIDRCEAEGVTNTLDIWEICWGDPDLEWLAQSSIDVFGYATTAPNPKTLAAVDTDSSIRRSRRPRFVAAARIPAGQVVG